MPNHISTNFRITGPTAEVKRFIKDAAGKDSVLSLDSLLPMPSELRMVSCPVKIMTQAEIDKQWADWREAKAKKQDSGPMGIHSFDSDRPFGLGMTQEQSDSLVAKYGTNNWYDWASINWGTKWGAYDSGDWVVTEGDNGNATAAVFYNTAWGPACPFFHHVSHQFPTLTFDTQVADEGGNFVSEISYEQGETTKENDYDWDSEEGIRVRKNVGYYDEYADEDEDDGWVTTDVA